MEQIRFGPSGNDALFYEQGFKKSIQAPQWLKSLGLECFEYSFGKGITLSEQTARDIGQAAMENGIAMSVHAPYYINLCSSEADKRTASRRYMHQAIEAGRWMGAKRVVFHAGSGTNGTRQNCMKLILDELRIILDEEFAGGKSDLLLCPETMGKKTQMGTVAEVLEMCALDERLVPAFDFGHIHALEQGALISREDYERILDATESILGKDRHDRIHIHFSHIEYTAAGERRHLTFEDTQYGPYFEHLAGLLAERRMTPVVICESKDSMARDALIMKQMYQAALSAIP